MSKNKKGNGHHHLTLSDRIYIESELNIGSTFKSIADFLGKDPSTISKEVRLHRTTPDPYKLNCDPYVSNQKAKLEKNHEYIRYVIPKGRSMNRYTQDDINLMASHINSTSRDGMNGASPFDLAELLLDKRIPLLVGQHRVSPDSVMLKPELIDKPSAKRRGKSR